jgi:Flp pilus assembly pilin Flp
VNHIVTSADPLFSIPAALRREDGQTMAEYGVVLSIAVGIVVAALLVLRTGIIDAVQSVVPWL